MSYVNSDEDEEEEVSKPKKAASKSSKKSQPLTAAVPSSSPFLTAAERNMQDKKLEKKNVDKPFSFLKDIRDKDGVRPGEPGYDPRTIYVPKSAWAEFTPFEKQVRQSPFYCRVFNLLTFPSSGRLSKTIMIRQVTPDSFYSSQLIVSFNQQILFFQKGYVLYYRDVMCSIPTCPSQTL